jgi:hypothetical protein
VISADFKRMTRAYGSIPVWSRSSFDLTISAKNNGLDNNEAVLGLALNQWDDCRSLDFTLAYTVNPASGRSSQIQLCPWFVDWAKGQKFKSFKDLSTKAWVVDHILVPACRINNWILTEIDVTSVFDKVILHEMTHTTGAGSLEDLFLFIHAQSSETLG